MELRYCVLDPTGNITALVESPVDIAMQPAVGAALMRRDAAVEQVGFVRPAAGEGSSAELRMAGGEFCGNAAMCAAALLLRREGAIALRVSGAAEPVPVRLRQTDPGSFAAELRMPPPLAVTEAELVFEGLRGPLPLVRMEGIAHLIVEAGSPFFALLRDRPAAERAARAFCAGLGAEGLGLMFLEGGGSERDMTPLVYIPGSGTLFWENSCASGSAAAGMALAARTGAETELALRQPGGVLRVQSGEQTRLFGSVRFVREYTLSLSAFYQGTV